MREFINLLERAATDATVTLYRGDNSKIDRFQIAKTDEGALLGVGIYLTDSPDVAKDYTVKGSTEIAFRPDNEALTPRDLTAAFLRKLINTDAKFEDRLTDLKNMWQQKYYRLSGEIDWSGDHEAARAERDRIQDEIQNGFQVERSKMIRDAMARAKSKFQRMRPDLRITKLTTGEYVFTNKVRQAAVARFEVPTSYLAKCLHAERPLPDNVIPFIKDAFTRAHFSNDPDGQWDLRAYNPKGNNGDEDTGLTFDQFIHGYRERGARYAWTDRWEGGKGENPSLDFIFNGTHSGYHAFQHSREKQMNLMDDLKKLGYVGYAYDGGVRLAGTGARGGGGIRHNAYVLWDEDAVHSFRVDDEDVTDDEVGALEKGIRAAKVLP